MPCRIARARKWAVRQQMESFGHTAACFITLTYAPEFLPAGGSLVPGDLQLWLKRLRKAIAPSKVRFFACGEYGTQSWRPHYHINLFGVSGFHEIGGTAVPDLVNKTWGKGITHVGEFTKDTARYVTYYATKRMTQPTDERLKGRYPEFIRMSNRPGLGVAAMQALARRLSDDPYTVDMLGDVPFEFKEGNRSVQLDGYLISKLRDAIGFTDDFITLRKREISMELSQKVLDLWMAAPEPEKGVKTFRSVLLQDMGSKLASVETRYKIRSSKRSI